MQSMNNFNNFNNFNNNNMNSNVSIQSSTDPYGNTTQTRTEYLPNGMVKTESITRAPNGNIIGQASNMSSGGNFMNNMNMNNINNMNMMNQMNMMNNMNQMNQNYMNDMFNQGMSMMNRMMFNMPMNNMMNQGFNMMDNNMMNDFDDNLNNGVDINLLNSLESTVLKDVSHLEEDKKQCVICMEDFKDGDEVIYVPCLHVFHKDCLLEWFKRHDDCPICKFKITFDNF